LPRTEGSGGVAGWVNIDRHRIHAGGMARVTREGEASERNKGAQHDARDGDGVKMSTRMAARRQQAAPAASERCHLSNAVTEQQL
jgi:hypothetical protein